MHCWLQYVLCIKTWSSYLQFVCLCFFLQDRDSVALLLNAKSPDLDVTVIKQPQKKKLILLPFISPTALCNFELIQKLKVYLLCGREGRNEEAMGCKQPRKQLNCATATKMTETWTGGILTQHNPLCLLFWLLLEFTNHINVWKKAFVKSFISVNLTDGKQRIFFLTAAARKHKRI